MDHSILSTRKHPGVAFEIWIERDLRIISKSHLLSKYQHFTSTFNLVDGCYRFVTRQNDVHVVA